MENPPIWPLEPPLSSEILYHGADDNGGSGGALPHFHSWSAMMCHAPRQDGETFSAQSMPGSWWGMGGLQDPPARVRAELFWHLVSLGFLAVIPYYPLFYLHSFGKSVKKICDVRWAKRQSTASFGGCITQPACLKMGDSPDVKPLDSGACTFRPTQMSCRLLFFLPEDPVLHQQD